MKNFFRQFTPKFVLTSYHYLLAKAAAFFYRYPSNKLIVIGVTGTTGKSTTIHLIAKILESAGYKVGVASTILFKVDKKERINDQKMTMVGRFALQKLIKQMVKANCQYAIIETTSQGIEQFRHLGVNYDVAVFTNLFPEHIEAHGSFENYKKAKLKLFRKIKTEKRKLIAGQKIEKIIIANLDDEHSLDFLKEQADIKFAYTLKNNSTDLARVVRAEKFVDDASGIRFEINNQPFIINLFGQHNIYNSLAAITVGLSQGISLSALSKGLLKVGDIPGRLEFINEGQNFKIIVDYAFEPKAMAALYEVVKKIPHKNILHVLGGTGGGRDKSRRPILGEMAGEFSRYVIVTNEDPYDEDPMEIINQVARGAIAAGKELNKDLFKILDRRQAIKKALILAKKDDIILITGKGSEQAIVEKDGHQLPWDDRKVVREELKNLKIRKNL